MDQLTQKTDDDLLYAMRHKVAVVERLYMELIWAKDGELARTASEVEDAIGAHESELRSIQKEAYSRFKDSDRYVEAPFASSFDASLKLYLRAGRWHIQQKPTTSISLERAEELRKQLRIVIDYAYEIQHS